MLIELFDGELVSSHDKHLIDEVALLRTARLPVKVEDGSGAAVSRTYAVGAWNPLCGSIVTVSYFAFPAVHRHGLIVAVCFLGMCDFFAWVDTLLII